MPSLSLFAKALLWYPAISLYIGTYLFLQLLWFVILGRNTWGPAWPLLRTGFVISIATYGSWALFSLLFILWQRIIIPHRHNARSLPYSIPAIYAEKEENIPKKPCSFTHWLTLFGLLLSIFLGFTYQQADDYRFEADVQLATNYPNPRGYYKGGKVFIAALFHDNEKIVPYWSREIIRTIHYLGTENVFISIVESHSHDHTPSQLLTLQAQLNKLGVQNRFLIGDTQVERPSSMETKPPRIQYLSALRNIALEPLAEHNNFDFILFSNDVFVEAESIIELLHTRGGDWDMVCGIDLAYWGLYDAWVTRDAHGRLVSSLWPYFLEESGAQAVVNEEPAPVFTCWNGIVVIRADPFLLPAERRTSVLSNSTSSSLPPTHPAFSAHSETSPAEMPPLRFRASADSECFSSESFLLPYDLRRQYDMQKIYMNTRVITSYEWRFYVWYKYILRHWLVRWYITVIEGVSKEAMKRGRIILGRPEDVWTWDGGDCHPW